MYFCISRYGNKIDYDEYYTVDNKAYILDTDDWSIEQVSFRDIEEANITIANLNIIGGEYSIAESDFIVCLNDYKDSGHITPLTHFNGIRDFVINISGVGLRVQIVGSGDYTTRNICINDEKVLAVKGTIEFNYIFIFGEYIVIRFTVWSESNISEYGWQSIAIDKNGKISCWSMDGETVSKIGTKIDMVSEV